LAFAMFSSRLAPKQRVRRLDWTSDGACRAAVYACGGGSRRSWRRRLTKLPPAAASSRNATAARISSGNGIEPAFEGPSHSIVRTMIDLAPGAELPPEAPPLGLLGRT